MRIVLIIKVLNVEDFYYELYVLERELFFASCTSHTVVVCLIETCETDEDIHDHLST